MAPHTAFSDSNDNASSSITTTNYISTVETALSPDHPSSTPDIAALRRLSQNLDSLFQFPNPDPFSDARIIVPGPSGGPSQEVPVHRCILSARSPFFRNIFVGGSNSIKERGGKIELKELVRDVHVGHNALVAVLGYLYSGKVRPLPDEVCICADDECSHLACRPAVDFMVEVLYAAFTFQIAELVTLYQRHLLDILAKVAVDDVLVILSVANMSDKACERLLTKCTEIVIKSDIDIVTLEKALPHDVVKKITDERKSLGIIGLEGIGFPDKHVKRIHRALESDDVELVRMLLKEGHTTLDDAYALHYAVAYCDSKITTELLDLGLADVNHKNPRGYTILHVAAMRREPKIIVSLLTKGAQPSDLTSDGRNALRICKRLTKYVDYHRPTQEGMATPKDRLCIEVLEQAERRDPLIGEASATLALEGDDLRSKLLYLESRVGLAKILFPTEAKVATELAQVDATLPLTLAPNSKLTHGNQDMAMDLNDVPFKIKEEHLARLRALSKTVELGKQFFPRCSAVLNKIVDDDDLTELANLEHGTSEERELKKRRFNEIQSTMMQAFNQDKVEFDRSTISSSSSSTTIEGARSRLSRK
ncbi:BTB/POZ domain and ankyrin repeat-containing protein NPR1-like [Magnolia sinica]|uniref:BTB/POZ domain and ankyrin repeat-containing protein NPR1-like n=1 Tax=Magnolia sinica TaxID=86752 RepID=UPI002659792C|nr:BTB/POZ domain and ankyrin repeat-containing protein NPR1-like [Magnolia sinica]